MKHKVDEVVPQRPSLKSVLQRLAEHFGMPGVKEWVRFIEDPLDYDDPIERQAIVKKNMQLISSKLALFQKFSGIDPSQSQQYVDNEGNFSNEEWQALQEIKDSLRDYEDAVAQVAKDFEAKAIAADDGQEEEKQKKPKRRMSSHKGWIPT